ncbi:MAG: hypothetical protein IJ795_04400 [Bacteroidales bacterium]|nr:hypothetical protein [Bacteroidales bacterium]
MDSNNKDFSKDFVKDFENLVRRVEALEREVALLKGEAPVAEEITQAEDIELDASDFISEEAIVAAAVPAAAAIRSEKPVVEEPVAEVVEEPVADQIEDMPEIEDIPTINDIPEIEDIPEPPFTQEDIPAAEPEEEEGSFESLFGLAPAPEKTTGRGRRKRIINDVESDRSTKAVMDVMADTAAWRHDIPGPEVKSLRSAIGLGDQVLFIRKLFRDDSALYQDSIDKLNSMSTLSEAISYLSDTFPEWDIASDDVYRFMMAVRRKIRR